MYDSIARSSARSRTVELPRLRSRNPGHSGAACAAFATTCTELAQRAASGQGINGRQPSRPPRDSLDRTISTEIYARRSGTARAARSLCDRRTFAVPASYALHARCTARIDLRTILAQRPTGETRSRGVLTRFVTRATSQSSESSIVEVSRECLTRPRTLIGPRRGQDLVDLDQGMPLHFTGDRERCYIPAFI